MRHDIIEYAEISPVIGRTVTVTELIDYIQYNNFEVTEIYD